MGHHGSVGEEFEGLAERIIAMLQQLLRRTNHNPTAILQRGAFVKAGRLPELRRPSLLLSSSHTTLTQMRSARSSNYPPLPAASSRLELPGKCCMPAASNHFDNMSHNGPVYHITRHV